MKKICFNCQHELPDDSSFCTYCGSDKVGFINEIVNVEQKEPAKKIFKRCIDCGKELPEDSDFCQFCGSKRVAAVNNETPKAEIKKDGTTRPSNVRIYQIAVAVLAVACLALGYLAYSNYNSYNILSSEYDSLQTNYTKLNRDYKTAKSYAETYRKKASYYDGVSSALSNQQTSSSFCADYYFLKSPSRKKVTIRATNGSSLYCQGYGLGNGLTTEWGNWNGYECPLYITYTGSGYGYLIVHNDYSGKEFKIFIQGK